MIVWGSMVVWEYGEWGHVSMGVDWYAVHHIIYQTVYQLTGPVVLL